MSASRFAVKAIRLPTRPRPVEKEVKVEEKEPVKEEKPVKGKSFCKYCHDNKFPEEVFTSHFTKASRGSDVVVCPNLLKAVCTKCKQTGHEVKYCKSKIIDYFCTYCRDLGHDPKDHFVRDDFGKTVCPQILKHKCENCGGIGHTPKLCASPRNIAKVLSKTEIKNTFCSFCGSKEHYVKDVPGENGKVVCPTLLNYKCENCGLKGHVEDYCKLSKKVKEVNANEELFPNELKQSQVEEKQVEEPVKPKVESTWIKLANKLNEPEPEVVNSITEVEKPTKPKSKIPKSKITKSKSKSKSWADSDSESESESESND
jgi:hypothetical protein